MDKSKLPSGCQVPTNSCNFPIRGVCSTIQLSYLIVSQSSNHQALPHWPTNARGIPWFIIASYSFLSHNERLKAIFVRACSPLSCFSNLSSLHLLLFSFCSFRQNSNSASLAPHFCPTSLSKAWIYLSPSSSRRLFRSVTERSLCHPRQQWVSVSGCCSVLVHPL